MMNMTGFRSVAAALDDTKAVLDSCSLDIIARACSVTGVFNVLCPSGKGREQHENEIEVRTFASSRLYTVGRLIIKNKSVWKILSWVSTRIIHRLDNRLGSGEGDGAKGDEVSEGEREIVITLVYFVGQPMNTEE